MKSLLWVLGITLVAGCHIISGGDEIVVEDDGGSTVSGEGEGEGEGEICGAQFSCIDDSCECTTPGYEGVFCVDPFFEPDPRFNCVGDCDPCF